jgi:hypothetical protein
VSDVEFDPAEADLSLASLFAGWALADEIQRRLAAGGHADLRFADGFVFQHLVGGPVTVSALAERLGVTQQAASKSVADWPSSTGRAASRARDSCCSTSSATSGPTRP